jgi:hypothetical protein
MINFKVFGRTQLWPNRDTVREFTGMEWGKSWSTSEGWVKIRTGHLPNASLPRYFLDIIDTWYGLFKKAVSISAWVALNEIGWLVNDGRERTLPVLRCHPTSRGTEEGHGIPRVSLSLDQDLTSELHENEAGILIIKPTRYTVSHLYFGKDPYVFRTDLVSIIRSLNTVCTAVGICHTSYVACTNTTNTNCCVYSI